jgi:diguanylate cyclase (GGDEF)-like protein/PAS domain S-box-containing protein
MTDKIDPAKEYQIIDIKDRAYMLSRNFYLKDYNGKDAVKVLYALDITKYKKETIYLYLFIGIIGGITFFISFVLMNTGFAYFIKMQQRTNRQLNEYFDIVDEHVIVSSTDKKGNITYASSAFSDISGFSKEELLGANHNIIKHPDVDDKVYKELWKTISKGNIWRGELKNRKKDGGFYWVYAIIFPNYENGKIKGYTAIRHDITDKKEIEKLSKTDKLTGIYNRLKLDTDLISEINRVNRYRGKLSVIILDIDKFKSVNDRYGHQVGDSVLVDIANIVREHIRRTDIFGRWGGEEFMIICPQTNINAAQNLAEKLRIYVAEHDFETVGKKSASFGVAQYRIGEKGEDMIRRADEALYDAKNSGRNRVCIKN